MIYLYDDTFVGLLNLINYLFKNKIKPLNIKGEYYSPTLIDKVFYPSLDKDSTLEERIINRIGEYAFSVIYHVYLSNTTDKELLIYNFLCESLKYKKQICFMRNIDCVSSCLKIYRYVKREAHRFKGFVRFKVLSNGILYSTINPENNILQILSIHFKNRLKDEKWIINDVRRNLVSVYDSNNYYITTSTINASDSNNDSFEDMWIEFYKHIGIKERKNERCRMNFMPKKYWKYIVEVSDEESC